MEIRVNVDDAFAKQLQEKLKTTKATEIARSALALLNWAADEMSHGREILSTNSDGTDVRKLVMPALSAVTPIKAPSK